MVDAVDEAKTTENENLLKDFQDRNQEALDEMKKSMEGSEGERKLLLDNVEHFESLRDNLEKSLSEKMEVVYACKKEVSDTQELLDSFKTKNEEIVKGEEACHTVRVTARAPEPSAEDPARGQDQAGEYQH